MATPAQLFDSAPTFGGAFSVDDTILTFTDGTSNDPLLGQLVQTIAVSYAREIDRRYEIGSHATYFIVGRAAGTCQLERLAAPVSISTSFLTSFSTICNMTSRTITLGSATNAKCGPQNAQSYVLNAPLITSLGLQASVGPISLAQSIQMVFVGLQIVNGPANATSTVPGAAGAVGA